MSHFNIAISELQPAIEKHGVKCTHIITIGYDEAGIVFIHDPGFFGDNPQPAELIEMDIVAVSSNGTHCPVWKAIPISEDNDDNMAGWIPCCEHDFRHTRVDDRMLIENGNKKFYFRRPVLTEALGRLLSGFDCNPPYFAPSPDNSDLYPTSGGYHA